MITLSVMFILAMVCGLAGALFKVICWTFRAAFNIAGFVLALAIAFAIIGFLLKLLGFLGIVGAIILIVMVCARAARRYI